MRQAADGRDDVARRIAALAGAGVTGLRRAGAQHGWQHFMVTLADGREAFAKVSGQDRRVAFEAEARGLGWLAAAGAVPLPDVLGWDGHALVMTRVPAGSASPAAARRFGRELALMHGAGTGDFGVPRSGVPRSGAPRSGAPRSGAPRSGAPRSGAPRSGAPCFGAPCFGAPWPGTIASLPLDNRPWPASRGWAEWYADRRVLPFLRRAADAGALGSRDVRLVEQVTARIAEIAGPAEPPSRIHGDCWSGNVLWAAPDERAGGRGWLIDPAAHGGHRETDLAMLALFGAPYLDRIIDGYTEAAPLAGGWRDRVPLHQLHPLLVHVCLFGAGYRDQAVAAARSALSL